MKRKGYLFCISLFLSTQLLGLQLKSSAFEQGASIPSKYTCEGEDINPPFEIFDVPENAKSLVLLFFDPDVPTEFAADNLWVHWVLFNLSPSLQRIEEGKTPSGIVGMGTEEEGYQGPCPPEEEHRYFFVLYALDSTLDLPSGSTKEQVENAMQGHIISQTSLMGVYKGTE